MWRKIVDSPSKSLAALALAAVVGCAAHAAWERPWHGMAFMLGAAASSVAAVLFWRKPPLRLAAAVIAVAIFSWSRYDLALAGLSPPPDLGAKTEFIGTVVQEPRQRMGDTILTVGDSRAVADTAVLPGRATISLPTWSDFRYGDRIKWRCKPKAIDAAAAGSDRLLLIDRVSWQCKPTGLPEVESRGGGGRVMTAVFGFKEGVRSAIGAILPEPESSFLMGLLLGDRDGIPDAAKQDFRDTGTSHILAVSGYNTAKVAEAVFLVLAVARLRRRRAAAFVALSLVVFTLMAGGEASVVRAAVMGSTEAVAAMIGRRGGGANALALAAASMLIANPFVFRHDLGFQLSFAALLGLRYLAKPLKKRLGFLPERLGIRDNFADTLAATAATAPISLAAFGRLPLISPVANLLILPAIPLAMGLGSLATLIGVASVRLGAVAAWPSWVILRYVEFVAMLLARWTPWGLEFAAGPTGEAVLYALIIVVRFRKSIFGLLLFRPRNSPQPMVTEYDI